MTQRLGRRPWLGDVAGLQRSVVKRTYLEDYITHPSFDGDSFSDVTTPTEITPDSWDREIPESAVALLIQVAGHDSASFPTGGLYVGVGTEGFPFVANARPLGGDHVASETAWVPARRGSVWYAINASGANTMDVTLRVWGWEVE